MAQKKGQTGNPNGRPKGSANKATTDLRKWVQGFISDQTDQIEKDWKALDPKDRITLFEKMLKYTLPQLQAVSNTIEFENLSESDLDKIIEELKK